MKNIVLHCNDRLGRSLVLLVSGGCYIAEANEDFPTPYVTLHSIVAVDVLNACLEKQIGPKEIRAINQT